MSNEPIYEPALMPHLLIDGLNRYHDEPCLYLGDKVASYRDVRESTSQMVQALHSLDLTRGSRVAVISGNRPEVLSNIAAMQIAGCIGSPLHPMGSLDDHSYVIEHAEIDALVFDETLFENRAGELQERFPSLQLLGFGPTAIGIDYLGLAASFRPQKLVAPDVRPGDVSSISYTGGTTGKYIAIFIHRVFFAFETFNNKISKGTHFFIR